MFNYKGKGISVKSFIIDTINFYEEIKSGDITLKMQRKSKMNLSGNWLKQG